MFRGLALSLLLHLFVLFAVLNVLPRLSHLVPVGDTPAPQVLTFRFRDETADATHESRTDQLPTTPFVGAFNAKARDRVRDDRDTPSPIGGQRGLENNISGQRGEADIASGATPAQRGAAPASETNPDGVLPSVIDGLGSEVVSLTGRHEERRRGRGTTFTAETDPGGALEFGEYSFSTRAWDYEPYWHYMRERLYANWHPPSAYRDYGIIPGGWTLVRAVLDRRGRVIRADIVGEEGHRSLHQASFAAMQGASPFRPLPTDFPEDSLVVTVKFIYMPPGQRP